jgi:hypothetical protein
VRGAEAWDRGRVHLEPVAGGDRRDLVGLRLARGEKLDQLLEILLETRRRDDLEEARVLVTCVPDGVPLTARLVDKVARAAVDDLVCEERPDPAAENVAVLVLPAVAVERRRQSARLERVLNE